MAVFYEKLQEFSSLFPCHFYSEKILMLPNNVTSLSSSIRVCASLLIRVQLLCCFEIHRSRRL